MRWRSKIVYPFTAIVGQERMKTALILNVINPKIGGVLLRGEKGTGKSLAVRALADLLPEIEVVANCPFNCDPFDPKEMCDGCSSRFASGEKLPAIKRRVSVVELPVGATEDRLIGTLDIERAIKTGEKHFEPGLLAEANRNILYIDEVNLLDDHLVDVLLDAAAMGVNYVEREGISFSHPAKFVLVGTMNPEEGELRPQLLDRFALSVEVKGIRDPKERAEIVKRRIAFENDPEGFIAQYQDEQEKLRKRIIEAQKLLPRVKVDDEMLDLITQICLDFGVDGHRADITIYKTACTLAAFNGRTEVIEDDIKAAAELALPHRRRRRPFEEPRFEPQQVQEIIQKWKQNRQSDSPTSNKNDQQNENVESQKDEPGRDEVFDISPPFPVRPILPPVRDEVRRAGSGRRSRSKSLSKIGRYVGSTIPKGKVEDLAFDATLRAAAPYQLIRRNLSSSQNAILIEKWDLREKVRERKIGNLIFFIVDASGSMAAEERMSAAKGAILSLLLDAYQRRDSVGMIAFRKSGAELVLPPTRSVELAQKYLSDLPTGGRTPLAHGLKLGLEMIQSYVTRNRDAVPLLVLISDGRANVSLYGGDPVDEAKKIAEEIRLAGINSIVIDAEQSFVSLGLLRDIASMMGGKYLRLEELDATAIASAVRDLRV
ncbi:MAG: putative cobaltochelatase [Candidatus Bathyarchaeia archaeon]